MSWWQWALILWFAAPFVVLLSLVVVEWWGSNTIDREWKRFNR